MPRQRLYIGPMRTRRWTWFSLWLPVALLGCPGGEADEVLDDDDSAPVGDDDDSAAWYDPGDHGPYEAGFVTLLHTDPRGKELTIEVWYPAAPAVGDEPDTYWPDLNFVFGGYRDASPVPDGAPYPLVAFSHGYGGIRYQSPYLTEHLARHGFVVAAVDHTHNTLADLDMDYAAQVLAERPADIRHTVDHVLDLASTGDPLLGGMVAGPEYAMLGHSFGAVTTLILAGGALDIEHALAYCEEHDVYACAYTGTLGEVDFDDAVPDERIVASVAMSPGAWYIFGPDGDGLGETAETLVFGGDQDAELDYLEEIRPTYEAMGAPKGLATLADAGHWGFSDICEIVPLFEECHGEGWMDVQQVHDISVPLTTAYLQVKLAGDDRYTPWLAPGHLAEVEGLTWESGE